MFFFKLIISEKSSWEYILLVLKSFYKEKKELEPLTFWEYVFPLLLAIPAKVLGLGTCKIFLIICAYSFWLKKLEEKGKWAIPERATESMSLTFFYRQI